MKISKYFKNSTIFSAPSLFNDPPIFLSKALRGVLVKSMWSGFRWCRTDDLKLRRSSDYNIYFVTNLFFDITFAMPSIISSCAQVGDLALYLMQYCFRLNKVWLERCLSLSEWIEILNLMERCACGHESVASLFQNCSAKMKNVCPPVSRKLFLSHSNVLVHQAVSNESMIFLNDEKYKKHSNAHVWMTKNTKIIRPYICIGPILNSWIHKYAIWMEILSKNNIDVLSKNNCRHNHDLHL